MRINVDMSQLGLISRTEKLEIEGCGIDCKTEINYHLEHSIINRQVVSEISLKDLVRLSESFKVQVFDLPEIVLSEKG